MSRVGTWVRGLSAGSVAVGGAVGLLFGIASSGSSSEPVEVRTEQVTLTEPADPAEVDRLVAAEVEEKQAQLEQRDKHLDQRKRRLDRRDKRLDKKAAELDDQGAVVAPEADPEPEPAYYENCDAARAAGAAPVRSGDAGYGSHLDRDGDGVACES